jgi:hypothetical protein
VVGVGHLLATEINHLVVKQGSAYLSELFVRDVCHADAANLRAHGRREWAHFDMPIVAGGVIETISRVEFHGFC